MPKAETVKKLIDLTFSAHPYVGIEAQLAPLPGRKDAKNVEENAVRSKDSNADGFAIWEPANLNKFINQFVSENYKK